MTGATKSRSPLNSKVAKTTHRAPSAPAAPAKVARLKSYGAVVHQVGAVYAEARAASEKRAAQTGALVVPAYEDPVVFAGAGSVALGKTVRAFQVHDPHCRKASRFGIDARWIMSGRAPSRLTMNTCSICWAASGCTAPRNPKSPTQYTANRQATRPLMP